MTNEEQEQLKNMNSELLETLEALLDNSLNYAIRDKAIRVIKKAKGE